jgi:hypothetical protein
MPFRRPVRLPSQDHSRLFRQFPGEVPRTPQRVEKLFHTRLRSSIGHQNGRFWGVFGRFEAVERLNVDFFNGLSSSRHLGE